ncbi:glycosyltransferase family 4 protein [Dethiosulfatarculus sandiegensis]|uniref:Glycosyl transferase family 1 domain-containing protein n=1 Tax=Dethiosulfatarculus sandiegensis TaxID=1429043 RepID=A0A0D2J622_9BACT|nr:glycosyltransferase family 4 protein [Dethiosulfatarculus sandiegensis]KIX13554.1 hypothetical protein X474_13795 [Dethiosulfatarculus sandiegensis]
MRLFSLDICFVTDGEPFHGASPEERALGGSETALVQVARALAQRGHRVMVFCRCPAPGVYHDVVYKDRSELVKAAPRECFDVLIVSRFFTALDLPLQAGLRVLWNHDILDKPGALAGRMDQLDLCLVLSRYHARDYALNLPECASKLVNTRNGLDLDILARASAGAERDPKRMIYVSRPERGLQLLLDRIWPRLKKRFPDLTLEVCGYEVDDTEIHPRLKEQYREIAGLLASAQDVHVLGGLPKEQYYQTLASSGMLLYPCVFPEISCIAALEAQALGTPLVTSNEFALTETVAAPEFLVSGKPGSQEYVEAYLERAVELLDSPERTRDLARQARDRIWAGHDWQVIAGEWERLFLETLSERILNRNQALAAGLVLKGANLAAEEVLGKSLNLPCEGQVPPDPDEEGLQQALAQALLGIMGKVKHAARLGVLAPDQGRSQKRFADLLPALEVVQVGGDPEPNSLDLLLIRDTLERLEDPAAFLQKAFTWCKEEGYILLCLASGAWPLITPGFLARKHDLGKKEILDLFPGRQVALSYLPRGLVGKGAAGLFVGRWLAMAPVKGPPLGSLDQEAFVRRTRPLAEEYVQEVLRAGLI